MNKSILILIALIMFAGRLSAQCNIGILNTSSDTFFVPCGSDPVLERDTLGAYAIFQDFNSGSVGLGWQTTSQAMLNNPCGVKSSTYLWMGNQATAPRNLTTVPLDLSCGGQICFELKYAIQGQGSPCEGPDLVGEGITLEYNVGGGPWTTINYFTPNTNGNFNAAYANAGDYTAWATYCYTIPPGAMQPNVSVRWMQYASTASGNDHWGLDSITISTNCGGVDNLWSTGDTTPTTQAATALSPSSYWVRRIIGANTNNADTCFDSIVVAPRVPDVFPTPANDPFCINTDAVISINPAQSNYIDSSVSYAWSWAPSALFDTVNQYYAMIEDIDSDTTVYYYYSHPVYPQCSSIDTVELHVGGVQFDSISITEPLCFRDNSNSGSVYFDWSNQLTAPIATLMHNGAWYYSTTTNQITNLPADSFTLTIRDSRCYDTIGFRITRPDSIIIDTSALNLDICQIYDKAQPISGFNGFPPYDIYWDNQLIDPLFLSADQDTTLSLFIEDTVGCRSDTINITFDLPDPITTSTVDTAVCPETIFDMAVQATGGLGTYEFLWRNGSTDSVITVQPDQGTTYWVAVKDGCVNPDTLFPSIGIHPVPEYGLIVTPKACQGGDIVIESPAGMGLYSVLINNVDTINVQHAVRQYSDTGRHEVFMYVETQYGCEAYDTAFFDVIPDPVASFEFVDTVYEIRVNDVIELNNHSEYASSYQWLVATEPYNSENVTHQFEEPGKHKLNLVALNELECADTTYAFVNVLPDREVYIPNSFTPNGDGINDQWDIVLPSFIDEFDIYVYDRWGKLVWESHSPTQNSWDGMIDGKKASSGMYVYRVYMAAPMIDKEFKEELNGNVFIIE